MSSLMDQITVPYNSISCFIGRICQEPSDNFATDGILYVDLDNAPPVNGDKPDETIGREPEYGSDSSTQYKAIASYTLRSAYVAWYNPPLIKYKGSLKLKGKISMNNAQLSNVTLSGGAPAQGTTTCGAGPGTAMIPTNISAASGTAKIVQQTDATIEMSTEDDNLDIELTSQKCAQLPWCIASGDSLEGDQVDQEAPFIREGDFALCMAFGNSLHNLFVVDILRF